MSSNGKSTSDYRVVRAVAAESRSDVVAVWEKGGLAEPGTTEFATRRYDWFYTGNPGGSADVSLLYSAKEPLPIGTLGIGQRTLSIGSRRVDAGVLVDFAVVPSHRSVFPALLLQRAARADAMTKVQVLLGLPDTRAVAICKRLESHFSAELRQYARVVRSRTFLERVLPSWVSAPLSLAVDLADQLVTGSRLHIARLQSTWVTGFDAAFDGLWEALDKSHLTIGIRDRSFLHWRFAQQPGHEYLTLKVARAGESALLAYFVCEVCEGRLVVKDMLVKDTADLSACLLALISRARERGAKSVETQLLASPSHYRGLRRAGFSHRGSRPFFAVLSDHLRDQVPGESWYVTQADEDV